MDNVILEMKGISKKFPGVNALDSVNLIAFRGSIMALVGENGAGKSTLMKILTGVYQKTAGEILYEGRKVEFHNTDESQKAGIALIPQELNLIHYLTIGENIFLGREPTNRFGKINWKKLYSDSKLLLDRLGLNDNPTTITGTLGIGKQKMVGIAKALSLNAQILIMDEPTDSLTDKETENLFKVMRELKANGKSIVYISHRLKEIFEVCDHATIMRDGQFIAEHPVSELTEDNVVELMVGRKLVERFPTIEAEIGGTMLDVKNLTNKYVKDINFTLKKGELLGISGLMGSGRTELAKTIYGALNKDYGEIIIDGNHVDIKSPQHAIKYGIAYVSEDRKRNGLITGLNIKENTSLSSLRFFSNILGVINKSKEENAVYDFIKKMSIKTPGIKQLVKNLSGGNQQKVSISKGLMTKPKVLILDEPTRGVDVGAKKEIYDHINNFKKEGMSIIMISSEITEIIGMSDRILIMYEGKISGELDRKNATQENIMKYAVGMDGGINSENI